jgi:hypothetical protein
MRCHRLRPSALPPSADAEPRFAGTVSRTGWACAATLLCALALAGCERRPGDPPKPSTSFAATPATAGIAGLGTGSGSGPGRAEPPNNPASDPPPYPLPRPSQPPASPASR